MNFAAWNPKRLEACQWGPAEPLAGSGRACVQTIYLNYGCQQNQRIGRIVTIVLYVCAKNFSEVLGVETYQISTLRSSWHA